jgi:hypothetical protein
MIGTKNAGLHELSIQLRMIRRDNRRERRATQEAASIPRKGLELEARMEMYFAVRSPIRWTL